MRILNYDIKGFRSLRKISWSPADLNVIIGPNGTGKSNLLRMLELISISAQGGLGKHIKKAGGMEPLVWDGISNNIRFYIKSSKLLPSWLADENWLTYGVELARLGKSGTYSIGEEQLLAEWRVYHDVDVSLAAPLRQPAIARSGKRVDADGQNLIPVLHTLYTGDRDFKNEIDSAMRAAFGNDYEELVFPPAADQRIQLRIRWRSLKREQSAADLSDGTLRFLILLTILATPSPPPLIAIDEPETGLHPSMLPIVAEYAVDAADRTQVFLTTHSPQFLDAFGDTKPTTTVAKWVDGETVLKTVDGKELEYWLKEYSLGALYRTGELEDMV
jgi:predicted ATPase